MTKLEKIRAAIRDRGIDGILIYDELNQRYLCDFAFTDGAVFISERRAELITDFRYYEMALNKADKSFTVSTPSNISEFISSIISEENIKILGFEGDKVTYSDYQRLKSRFGGVELVDIGNMISDARQIKTDEEIAIIQRAQDITDRAFADLLSVINYNMTEIEVAAELEYSMRKNGACGFAFDTISVSGASSSLPHGVPGNEKLKRGFLTLDYGAKLDGYCSDMTRTIVIGKADDEMKRLYNTVLKAQRAALDYISEGADCGEADKISRDIIDSIPEYKGCFGHSLGHSVGLQVHEEPRLSRRSFGQKMRVGEIYTVEPGIYILGKYGCRIEDMIVIRSDGIHNFTKSGKDLIEI